MTPEIRKLLALTRVNIFSHEKPSHSKLFWALILAACFPVFVSLVLALTVGFFGKNFYQDVSGNVVEPQLLLSEYSRGSAKIYDRNGEFLYQFVSPTDGLRQPVPLSEISSWVVDATISVEDPSFYTNNGLNITGILRAAVENLLPWFSSQTNQVLEGSGGSSITQQLAKNIYIPEGERLERSYTRKLKETVVALELTRKYPKDDILVWYLNSISYGGPYVGIEAASLAYFGKKSKDLTLAESALLAGIPQSPALYDPFSPQNFDPTAGQIVWGSPAKARQSGVLDLMVRRGVISRAQAEAAAMESLEFQTIEFDIDAPHFILGRVSSELISRFGQNALFNDGLVVTTTLDLELQRVTEQVLESTISDKGDAAGLHNGAVLVLDPQTGQILTYVGSRDYFRDDIEGRNDNIISLNSPGSTLKPFGYLTAFAKGWGTQTAILDTPFSLIDSETDEEWRPVDPLSYWAGPLSVAKSLGNSLNVSAIKMAVYTGVPALLETLQAVGYTSFNSPLGYGPALITGGSDISLFDHVIAYSVLANKGIMRGQEIKPADRLGGAGRDLEPISLLEVSDFSGDILYKFEEPSERRILGAEYAYLVTSILSNGDNQCLVYATCNRLKVIDGYPTAAKTGTSEPFAQENVPGEDIHRLIGETWTIGYTPNIVVGVWAGNSDNSIIRDIYSTTVAFPIWRQVMVNSFEILDISPDDFVRPPGISEIEVCWPSGRLLTEYCPDWRKEKSLYATEVLERIQRNDPIVMDSVDLTPTPVPIFDENRDKVSLEDSGSKESEFIPATDGWDVGLNYESGYDDWWKLVLIDRRTNEIAGEATPKEFVESQVRLVLPWNEVWEWEQIFEWARLQGISDLIPRFAQKSEEEAAEISLSILYPRANEQLSGIQRISLGNTYGEFSRIGLELSALGSDSWTLLAEQSSEATVLQEFVWDTRLFPDGYYLLRASILLPDMNYSEYQVPVNLENGLSGPGSSIKISGISRFSVVRGISAITADLSGPDIRHLSIFVRSGMSESEPQLLERLDSPTFGMNSFLFDSTQYENGIYSLIFELHDESVGLTTTSLAIEINNLSR